MNARLIMLSCLLILATMSACSSSQQPVAVSQTAQPIASNTPPGGSMTPSPASEATATPAPSLSPSPEAVVERADYTRLHTIPDNLKDKVNRELQAATRLEQAFVHNGKTYILLKSPQGDLDVDIVTIDQKGKDIRLEYVLGGTRKARENEVLYALGELNGEYNVSFTVQDFTEQTRQTKYLDQNAALELGKRMDTNSKDLKWSISLAKDMSIEVNNESLTYTFWLITAKYPAGNKMLIYLDAITGRTIMMQETEVN